MCRQIFSIPTPSLNSEINLVKVDEFSCSDENCDNMGLASAGNRTICPVSDFSTHSFLVFNRGISMNKGEAEATQRSTRFSTLK